VQQGPLQPGRLLESHLVIVPDRHQGDDWLIAVSRAAPRGICDSLSALRVLFCCRPAFGHVYPLLPLAVACRDAGHEVLFGTGERFVPRLRERGFRAERVGISIDEADRLALRADPGLNELPRAERWRFGVVVFGDVLARRTLDDVVPLLQATDPDLLVYDETDVGAGAGAHLAGVPAVAHSLGRQVPDRIRRAVLERLARDSLPSDLFEANPYLDICPPSLQDTSASEPRERIQLRPVAPIEPADAVPAWIAAARFRPLVYVTLGTYVAGHVGSLRAAAAGVGSLDVDVLVTVGPDGDPSALGPVPGSVRVERFVPQGVLLPHVDLVVHHGGSGTLLGALAHGLPQLVLPHGADQFTNAQALLDSGAGRRLLPEEISSESVAGAVRALLSEPGFRDAARGLADEIAAMPEPAERVTKLEQLSSR
jgi:UDP:flavonoid glycosyltransferase YjiC (YdhE family)